MNKRDTLEKAYDLGLDYESRATNCCQSTIAAIQDAIDLRNDDIFRAGSALCGGLAFSSKGTCGALTGAAMVIGQVYGRTKEKFYIDVKSKIDDPDFDYVKATEGWKLAYELYELFLINYGSCICFDVSNKIFGRSEVEPLIRHDSPAMSQVASKIWRVKPHSKEGCGTVVGNAAKWATEIILREGIPKSI